MSENNYNHQPVFSSMESLKPVDPDDHIGNKSEPEMVRVLGNHASSPKVWFRKNSFGGSSLVFAIAGFVFIVLALLGINATFVFMFALLMFGLSLMVALPLLVLGIYLIIRTAIYHKPSN